jgi:hypothetical protein
LAIAIRRRRHSRTSRIVAEHRQGVGASISVMPRRVLAVVARTRSVRRTGDHASAFGPFGRAPAERKRTREMAAQTAVFIEDPTANLPHFPLWDMNRGFGP